MLQEHESVAIVPRSPFGYNAGSVLARQPGVAIVPRSPFGYNMNHFLAVTSSVAIVPRSPFGYNPPRAVAGHIVGCDCSPISLRLQYITMFEALMNVAIVPRSPFGYNDDQCGHLGRELRLFPDLPSATMASVAVRAR